MQSKIKAIQDMPAPQCKKRVQSFIGMLNYLSKFSARLSEITEPIRELCKEKVAFNWGPEHDGAFQLVKKEIAAAPILAYYNPKKPTILKPTQAVKDGVHVSSKIKNMYILPAELYQRHKRDML